MLGAPLPGGGVGVAPEQQLRGAAGGAAPGGAAAMMSGAGGIGLPPGMGILPGMIGGMSAGGLGGAGGMRRVPVPLLFTTPVPASARRAPFLEDGLYLPARRSFLSAHYVPLAGFEPDTPRRLSLNSFN